ncbi:HEAT repeat domain-containing protein [Clostridium sp. SYSU_GA19001]|uniref:HEAT repeat domain-containing protein n=1 Tax=Clostridium caldaquaticum TaxID=2940653 RepID=UPI002076EF2A|nr:HEAT repeat domain-containing protein [Clostridium caldaquaticum]MCM8709820.1 HEAT repeat domain-containing protein [Clostridium caldaquaticum]
MEGYVYYSIVLFSFFIFLLYVYLFYEKILDLYSLRKKHFYEKEVIPFIDNLFLTLETRYVNKKQMQKLRKMVKNKTKRNIIIERIIHYNEIYSGTIRERLTMLCENSGLVYYETKKLKSRDHFKTALACKNLGEFRSERAIPSLLKVFKRSSLDIKYHSLMALAKIGNLEAFTQAFNLLDNKYFFSERSLTEIIDSYEGDKLKLYKAMIQSENIFVSTVFINSAGNYMDIELNNIILKYIDDNDKERRIAAIKAIGKNGDIRYIDEIIKMLYDKEWEVRAAAAKSLGRFEDERALYPLIKVLSDSVWWVRYNAANSLIKIKNGIDELEIILSGEDRFAKDIIISALEDSGVIQDIYLYEQSKDESRKRLSELIKKYIESKETYR